MNSKLTGKGDEEEGVKKTIDIFTYKQRILSIDMKTKVVQQVESEWMKDWKSGRAWEWENYY